MCTIRNLLSLTLVGMFTAEILTAAEKRDNGTVNKYPFIYGAQYYRAPTPAQSEWECDLKHFSELGFTDIKFWVQWRWGSPAQNEYYFDDLDDLMIIARKNNLRVTLNAIFDVSPIWLYDVYPDAKQIRNDGQTIEPYVVSHRQIGGHPGPCYNHPGAKMERQKFFREAILHFKKYDNLVMWDVWNEPELSFPQRDGQLETLACYCAHCKAAFLKWLQNKYSSIDELNRIWGRNYREWLQVELPKNGSAVIDFVDWREFQADVLLSEADWRLNMVRELAPECVSYLHVVPNTMQPFNAVSTCMDDFEVARKCDVFAATMNNGPFFTPQVISAGKGKVCYNVESHINGGRINMHQPAIRLNDLLNDFLPQVGMGIKGFLFWQYRPESLGMEAPAWGVVNSDGSDRTVTKAAEQFGKTILPYANELMKCTKKQPQVAIWKSRKNEIFHYCMSGNFESLAASVNAYATFLYEHNFDYCFVNSEGLHNLEGVKVLIMPSCYYLTSDEVEAVTEWVSKGGVLLNEAHMGAYNGDIGRHNEVMPGFGLDEKWDVREIESVSTFRLKTEQEEGIDNMTLESDVKKMLRDFGTAGGKYVPLALNGNGVIWGALRYAKLQVGEKAVPLAYFDSEMPSIVKLTSGRGAVYYCGTHIGEGSLKDATGFNKFMCELMKGAGVAHTLDSETHRLRIETLYENNQLKFFVVQNVSESSVASNLNFEGAAKGLFTGMEILKGQEVLFPQNFCDIFIVNDK